MMESIIISTEFNEYLKIGAFNEYLKIRAFFMNW